MSLVMHFDCQQRRFCLLKDIFEYTFTLRIFWRINWQIFVRKSKVKQKKKLFERFFIVHFKAWQLFIKGFIKYKLIYLKTFSCTPQAVNFLSTKKPL